MTLRHYDLFSGIGGFALGLRMAGGFTTVGFCEIDPYCQKVLAKHWPEVPIHDDIRTFDADAIGPIDIITGGFPCQPFSLAGQRRGAEDNRHLWPEMLRVIERARPTWVVGENVNGLVSMVESRGAPDVESRTGGGNANGADYTSVFVRQENMLFDRVCQDLGDIGYAVQPFVIPACAVDAPHRRDRVWIVAHAHGSRTMVQRRNRIGRDEERDAAPEIQERRNLKHRSDTTGQPVALAHAARLQRGRQDERSKRQRIGAGGQPVAYADTTGERLEGAERSFAKGRGMRSPDVRAPVDADVIGAGLEIEQRQPGNDGAQFATVERSGDEWCRWQPEPNVGRVAHGISKRVDRLKGLGNAVVPPLVAQIARAIIAADQTREAA